jgi:hypothetical protein
LNINRVKPKAILLDDSVNPTVAGAPDSFARIPS